MNTIYYSGESTARELPRDEEARTHQRCDECHPLAYKGTCQNKLMTDELAASSRSSPAFATESLAAASDRVADIAAPSCSGDIAIKDRARTGAGTSTSSGHAPGIQPRARGAPRHDSSEELLGHDYS